MKHKNEINKSKDINYDNGIITMRFRIGSTSWDDSTWEYVRDMVYLYLEDELKAVIKNESMLNDIMEETKSFIDIIQYCSGDSVYLTSDRDVKLKNPIIGKSDIRLDLWNINVRKWVNLYNDRKKDKPTYEVTIELHKHVKKWQKVLVKA